MDYWKKQIDKESISEFYDFTVDMVYSAVYDLILEPTKTEQAIVKSYVELYQKRANLMEDEIEYEFGNILQENAKAFANKDNDLNLVSGNRRNLDEYTRNFMKEKILNKINSVGFKFFETISTSETKTDNSQNQVDKLSELIPVTPVLLLSLIILAIIIGCVSYTAVTLPYKDDPLVNEKTINSPVNLSEKIVNVLDFLPLKTFNDNDSLVVGGENEIIDSESKDSDAETNDNEEETNVETSNENKSTSDSNSKQQ